MGSYKGAWAGWLLAAAVAALALRLLGVGWGLPQSYNADEPHIVNLAVSFGAGTLKPYAFKYPTLWPYLLAACYGAYFVFWSGFGLLRAPIDFAALFGWEPGNFYFIARLLAAAFSVAACGWILSAERRRRPSGVPWAALLLAFAPVLTDLGHTGKPDSLMFFFVCAAWSRALAVLEGDGRAAHRFCGLFLGLAAATQYTAIPLAAILPLSHFLGPKPRKLAWLGEGLLAGVLGFFIGAPYVFLDFPRFWETVADMRAMAPLAERGMIARQVLGNVWNFAAPGSTAGLAGIAGAALLLRQDRRLALLLLGPCVLYGAILGTNPDGGWSRYLLPAYPALALLAAEGLALCERPRRPALLVLAAVTALVPGIGISWSRARVLVMPDTRVEAGAWLRANVPMGAGVLLDLPHASPDLAMSKEQLEELAARTRKHGSPRARLYEAMAARHPGGGWRVYRLQRTARELRSWPGHVDAAQADAPMLDVRPGLDVARAMRVGFVVTTSFGAIPERAPELFTFFEELPRRARLAASFIPEHGRRFGPVIRVYAL